MSLNNTNHPAIHISGDTLALDPKIRKHIATEAERLRQRYPTTSVVLRIGINEEFDPARGHRVRCELAAEVAGRGLFMVRDAQKEAFAAISAAFTSARKHVRRLATRTPGNPLTAKPARGVDMRALGT